MAFRMAMPSNSVRGMLMKVEFCERTCAAGTLARGGKERARGGYQEDLVK